MSAQDWIALSAILLCLLLSFVVSCGETALRTFFPPRMLRMEKAGNRRAALVNQLAQARERLAGAVLIGNTGLRVCTVALATVLSAAWFGRAGAIQAAFLMTAAIVILTDMLPRMIAVSAPERIALLTAQPLSWAVRGLGPLHAGIDRLLRAMLSRCGVRIDAGRPVLSAHEETRGDPDNPHRDMPGVLNLRGLKVSDVMIHRTEMITVCVDRPAEEVVEEILSLPATRIPLWSGKPENIVGILHVGSLLKALHKADGKASALDLVAISRPPWFVPTIRPLAEQLKAFRRRKTPLALVVDEYGETMGLVTLEDVVEEIVGDISDVHDVEIPGLRPQPGGSVTVEGAVAVRDVNRAMEWSLPEVEATTIAGLVIHEARSIPDVGQTFTFHGFRFRVLRKERNRLTSLRITPLD
jgi:Mg2+/Co2+ transporter CorB